jgi:hypothetical protein
MVRSKLEKYRFHNKVALNVGSTMHASVMNATGGQPGLCTLFANQQRLRQFLHSFVKFSLRCSRRMAQACLDTVCF